LTKISKYKIFWLGIILSIFYWLTEALIHVYLFKTNENIFKEIISEDINELVMRIVVISLILLLGVISQYLIINQKKLVQKIKVSEEKLKKFMESATDGFILFDAKLNYIDANKVILQIVGMNKEELIGKNILELAPDFKEIGMLYNKFIEVLKTGKSFSTEDITSNIINGSSKSYFSLNLKNLVKG